MEKIDLVMNENTAMDRACFRHNDQMTLKPAQKMRRKNKKTRLQELYDEGKVTSEEFYIELTKFIKWRLMTDLIRRGYYVNGVKQSNFTRDECDACYTHVLHKIINEYNPKGGTLATYARWQVRGWGQLVIQKQVRNYKYNPKGLLSLDNPVLSNVKVLMEYRNKYKSPDYMEASLDKEHFGESILSDITSFDINHIREEMKDFSNSKEFFEWLE